MPKYQVTGTMTIEVDVVVEADDPESAEDLVASMSYDRLTDSSGKMPSIEIEDVVRLKKQKGA